MKWSTLSLLVLGALVVQACGEDGTPGAKGADGKDAPAGGKPSTAPTEQEASLSLVTPSKGVLDREVEVSIGGNGTTFADDAKLSFGKGIEVLEVTTSTPTLINAKIRIASDAEVGVRDVTIGELTAKGAFTVVPAINVVGPNGQAKVPQGGLVQFAIENNDTRAFDPNAFRIEAGDLIDLGSAADGSQSATAFLLAPPLAKTGESQISVFNLDSSGQDRLSFLSAGNALSVTARAATTLATNDPVPQAFANAADTKLLKLSAPANEAAIVDYRIEVAGDSSALPVAFLFGPGGGKDDRLGQVLPARNSLTGEFAPPPYDLHVAVPLAASTKGVSQFVVLADLAGGQAGSTAKITASRTPSTFVTESASAHGSAAPQLVGTVTTSAGQVVGATLAATSEVDAYRFTVPSTSKLQLVIDSAADLEVVFTKDPTVIEDPQGTPAGERKVLGYSYPGKQLAAQRTLTAPIGVTDVYVVVLSDAQGAVPTGAYSVGVRAVP